MCLIFVLFLHSLDCSLPLLFSSVLVQRHFRPKPVGAPNGVSASVIASVTTFFHQDNFSDHFLLVFFFGASSASALHLAFTLKQCVFLSVLNVHILLSLCSTSISFLLFLGSQVTDDSCPYETFWCRKFLLLLGSCCIWCLGSLFFWNKKNAMSLLSGS